MRRINRGLLLAAVGSALIFWPTATVRAQGLFATLTGVVTDPSTAVLANAKVKLRDNTSGSERDTVTDSHGYYTFASVPVGSYSLSVEAPGFQTYKTADISLGGGEKRNVNVQLQVGSTSQTVEVTGAASAVAPVDSGEKSDTLTTRELQNYVQVSSNAAEYIKIMPGFGIQNGAQNKQNYSGQTIGINANGDSGSQSPLNNAFSYNGLPSNTLDIVADGAHVSDPGCNCDTPVNPNSDFIQEFKILASNFSAEEQKGPMVITSVTKSGGSEFHGNAFFYARNYALNSNDAYFNATGSKQPQDKYYYPGGSIGGPVLLPWTQFNRKRDKLFFFTGYEYFYQVLDTGLLTATVPTPGELTGNFSPAEVAKEGAKTGSGNPPGQVNQTMFPGGQIPASLIDPNMVALMKLYPAPNADPSITGGFNYVKSEVFNQNNFQWTTRGDLSISDNTKLFVRYNMQRETQQFPVGLWWRQSDQVPYPTPVQGKNRSDSVTGSLTHVFSPTMTNEVVFAYTFVGFPNVFEDPSKVDRSKVGYTYPGIFHNGVAQIPSFGGNGGAGEAALVFQPGGFEAGGAAAGLYANKYMPSASDTLTKVWGTHTFKTGFFYEWIRNAQPANNDSNGYMQFVPTANPTFTYGNAYADMVTGNMSSYTEANFNRINDISYNTYEGFLQDSWKVTPRLTLELGLRMTHFTPWADDEGFGYSTFNPSQYSNASCAAAPTFCGFSWHSRNPAIPVGGFPMRTVFWQPRFGLAYDVTGKGNTVLRGGWGRFYYHSGQFTAGLDTSAGSESITLSPTTIGNQALVARNLSSIPFTAEPAAPSAVDSKDDRQPYTDSYSFTISQRMPWTSLLEVSYVGNQSNDLQNTAGAGSNINLVPVGAMLSQTNPATANANNFRPFLGYGDINLATNNLYANYNALQVTWARQKGRFIIQMNYSYQKALGIVSPSGGQATLDPFNLGQNYGVQPGDRRQLFNASYSIELGSPVRGNLVERGIVNGWQLSGITTWESGANLTYNSGTSDHFNMQLNSAIIPGSISTDNPTGISIGNQSILGTNAIQLNPILTCNPTANLAPHQYVNGSCFAAPTQIGVNGPTLLPAAYGPSFFNSDLGLFKNFQITESKKLQFRIQAYNFLNHPLWSFPNSNNLTLQFKQATPGGPISQTNSTFGTTTFKQGNRIVELALKFYF
ncbi:MAG TPA: carboxypeptidase-like regulatory domain-containing protein [Bryobacteraceae bacterium]|nr:carboxypeptidase-like regulatory domain-containing protein [Bryobacteraceae bacterium]